MLFCTVCLVEQSFCSEENKKEQLQGTRREGKEWQSEKKAGHFYEAHAKEHNPKLPTNDVMAAAVDWDSFLTKDI